jgi:hypothetical protein
VVPRSLLSGEVSALYRKNEVSIMCGRYTLGHSVEDVIERFAVQQLSLDMPPRYNIAPTQPVAVCHAKRHTSTRCYPLGPCSFVG